MPGLLLNNLTALLITATTANLATPLRLWKPCHTTCDFSATFPATERQAFFFVTASNTATGQESTR